MSRESTLILLGIITVVLPFSGLPLTWLSIILPIMGIAIAGIAFALRGTRRPQERQPS